MFNLKFGNLVKASTAIAACLFATVSFAQAEKTQYPLTINNCGRVLTFDKAPQSVVSAGQNSTEILYLLGLSDKVKATALWFNPVLPEFTEVNSKIERLADNVPSFESVVNKKPDLVASQYEWLVGPVGTIGTYEQFNEVKIPVYNSPADCDGKDNSAGSDGLRSTPFEMALIYKEIDELSKIFDVQDRGQEVINSLKAREKAAIEKVKGLPKDKISGFMWYSSMELEMDPYVAGTKGAPNYMFEVFGIKNIIASEHEWPMVGWETIVKSNPTIIVAATMERRRFPADDIKVKEEFLQKDPVASLMDAAKNKHIIELDVQAMNGSIHTIEGIEIIADALEKFNLDK
ncbi:MULTISPECIES: ABC transporter substrate-binding protein [unclassified Bartonella]|uniref:ABC transporter substrate-binding protein n=1 Tax=unclassified Bartonella TaxID=2645622 RepID=UPI0015F86830|nr:MULTISPECIES: ABC transporter substrate-binding protein [unclassified Bartonella]UXN03784.1 ABC transporter substrate-binding protein [Bartonella sp. HY406]UXN06755.1 ABC transporter substrate-binding protein [Bartonella sp. HY761]